MVQPILRIKKGMNLSEKMAKSLSTLLPNYKTEYFDDKSDDKQSINERIDSLYKAFLFVLDSYPADLGQNLVSKKTWQDFALKRKKLCKLENKSFVNMYKELEKFTAVMVESLTLYLPSGGKEKKELINEAIETLNEAEEFHLLSIERPDVATIIPNPEDPDKFILQIDKATSSNYAKFTAELDLIRQQNFPKTPVWLQERPMYQQTFFCNLGEEIKSLEKLKNDYQQFLKTWFAEKSKSPNWDSILKQIYNETGPAPDWYNKLKPCYKSLVKELSATPATCDANLDKLKVFLHQPNLNIDVNFFSQVSKIHEWYWVLPLRQQYFLEHVIKGKFDELGSLNISLYAPSRMRRLAWLSNLRKHLTYVITNEGRLELLGGADRNGSAHAVSRETLDKSQLVQKYIATANFEQITSALTPIQNTEAMSDTSQWLLMQTLISDLRILDYVPTVVDDWVKEKLPDNALAHILRIVIYGSKYKDNVFQHNHALNGIANYCEPTLPDNPDSMALIKAIASYCKNNNELQILVTEYNRVLEITAGYTQLSDNGRELFLSSLEQLMFFQLGGSVHGTCMSGKDREALLLIHIDAMLHYKNIYGAWPSFGAPQESIERKNFVKLIAQLYLTRHQHVMSSLNAPGAAGIKTVHWYFPDDMVQAIKNLTDPEVLTRHDVLATTNEVKKIGKVTDNFYPANKLRCHLVAMEIGEKTCTELYTNLYAILNERDKFASVSKPGHTNKWLNFFNKYLNKPQTTGFDKVFKRLDGSNADQKNVDVLSDLCALILTHCGNDSPKKDNVDAESTDFATDLYLSVENLINPAQSGANLAARVDSANTKWLDLFDTSKKMNEKMNESKSTGI